MLRLELLDHVLVLMHGMPAALAAGFIELEEKRRTESVRDIGKLLMA